jgi:HK97 family phage major capsid protein
VVETERGTTIPIPSATAHGTGSWVAESGAHPTTGQDDTFAQTNVSAHRGVTRVVVSEELAQDSGIPFDAFMASELGGRLSMLEESGFAVGDGSGKPLGIAHASSGITTVTAAIPVPRPRSIGGRQGGVQGAPERVPAVRVVAVPSG